jgi:hypothetical protein
MADLSNGHVRENESSLCDAQQRVLRSKRNGQPKKLAVVASRSHKIIGRNVNVGITGALLRRRMAAWESGFENPLSF